MRITVASKQITRLFNVIDFCSSCRVKQLETVIPADPDLTWVDIGNQASYLFVPTIQDIVFSPKSEPCIVRYIVASNTYPVKANVSDVINDFYRCILGLFTSFPFSNNFVRRCSDNSNSRRGTSEDVAVTICFNSVGRPVRHAVVYVEAFADSQCGNAILANADIGSSIEATA